MVKISELQPGQGSVNIEVTIKSLDEPRTFNKFGKDLRVANAIVTDGESEIKLIQRGARGVRISYPIAETKIHCLKHYLNRKAKEYNFSATASESDILADLRAGHDEFKTILGDDGVAYLKLWEQVLTAKV